MHKQIFGLLMLLMIRDLSAAEIYRWIDNSGNVHFSDKKPVESNSKDVTDQYDKNDNTKVKTPKGNPRVNGPVEQSEVLLEFDTKNFSFSQNQQNYIVMLANQMHEFYQKKLGWPWGQSITIPVKFVSKSGYDYTFHIGKTGRSYYISAENVVVIRVDEEASVLELKRSLLHEVSHAIIRSRFRSIPKWLNEGLSEHMEELTLRDNSVVFDFPFRHLSKLRKQIRYNELEDLYSFFSSPPDLWRDAEFHAEKIRNYYSTSWSLVRYMIEDENGALVLLKLLDQVEKLGSKIDAYTIIGELYPTGISGFESNWKSWILEKNR